MMRDNEDGMNSNIESDAMKMEDLRPLPPVVVEFLRDLDASPRLLAHLVLVHDVAARLLEALTETWPQLPIDAGAVLLGAATHDIGKVRVPEELIGPGTTHAVLGQQLLEEHGFPTELARYARTHETWAEEPDVTPEDLLVALSDYLWRGKRDAALEGAVTSSIADAVNAAPWAVFLDFDDIATELAQDAPRRLHWLAQFTVEAA
jgi:putative nucleotidyltransferase with HDIG domain